MMRKRGIMAVIVVAVATIETGSSQATERRATFPSEIVIEGYGSGRPGTFTNGYIRSGRSRCLPNRTVKMFAQTNSGEVLIDEDVSSDNGYWGGRAAASGVTGFRVRMLPRRLGPDRRCAGDSDTREWPQPRKASWVSRGTGLTTGLSFLKAGFGPNFVDVIGKVDARRRCRTNRLVRIFGLSDDHAEKVAADHASANGYFGIDAHGSAADGVRAVAPRKRLRGPKSKFCHFVSLSELVE